VNPLIVAIAVVAVAAFALGLWREPSERARRTIGRAPRKRLGETRTGDCVAVRCVVRRGLEELSSPLTGRPCVAYALLLRADSEDEGPVRSEDAVPFVVEADGIEAVVSGPVTFAYNPVQVPERSCPGLDAVLHREGRDRHGFWGTKSFGCYEALARAGDEVMVLGEITVEVDPAGRQEELRGPPVRRVIRGDREAPLVVDHVRRPDRGD
jgi:hypothetical protein